MEHQLLALPRNIALKPLFQVIAQRELSHLRPSAFVYIANQGKFASKAPMSGLQPIVLPARLLTMPVELVILALLATIAVASHLPKSVLKVTITLLTHAQSAQLAPSAPQLV